MKQKLAQLHHNIYLKGKPWQLELKTFVRHGKVVKAL